MLIHWIWLAHRPGLTDRAKGSLLQHFSDPEDIFFSDSAAFDHMGDLSDEAKEALQDKNLIPAEEILENADAELIIPMNAHCESLNAAVAATIVMWQMKV